MKVYDWDFTYHGLSMSAIDTCRDCQPDKTGYILCDYHEAVVHDLEETERPDYWHPKTPIKNGP